MMNHRAFTFVELLTLLVAGGLMAVVTVPGIIESDVRAKISEAQSGLETLGQALDTYAVDNNAYPFDIDSRGWLYFPGDCLSTPTAYIADTLAGISDPFRVGIKEPLDLEVKRYRYVNFEANRAPDCWSPCPIPGPFISRWIDCSSDNIIDMAVDCFGLWRVNSAGPDGRYSYQGDFFISNILYDPTNGIISVGDMVNSPIIRTSITFLPNPHLLQTY